jgi:hypothetical protein
MNGMNDLIKTGVEMLDASDTSVVYHNHFHDTFTLHKCQSYCKTSCIEQSFDNLIVAKLSKNARSFMEATGLSMCLQEAAAGPYPELDESSPHTKTIIKVHVVIHPFRP